MKPTRKELFSDPDSGLFQEVLGYDELFTTLSQAPLIVNDYDVFSKEGREELNKILMTKYDGDMLSNAPRCGCGKYKDEKFIGITCEVCHSKVEYTTEKKIESLLWAKVPKGIPAFINLTVWRILQSTLTATNYSILEWLCNPSYKPVYKRPAIMDKVESLGLRRGLRYFTVNYEEVITILFENRIIAHNKSKAIREQMYKWLMDNIEVTFSKVLPFPSQLVFITEESNNRTWVDPTMAPAIDAILTLAQTTSDAKEPRLAVKEARIVKAMNSLDEYYSAYESSMIFGKPGIYRKLVLGTRPAWTFRAVIVSRHSAHQYDELIFPWSLSVSLYRSHLINLLLKKDFTPQEISALLAESSINYNPLIDKLLQQVFYGGPRLPHVTWQRFPSLRRQSNELMRVGGYKTDPSDNTIEVSNMTLINKNADFDGDMLSGQAIPCNDWIKKYEPLLSHHSSMDFNEPFRVTNGVTIPSPVISTANNWLSKARGLQNGKCVLRSR